MRSVRRQTVFVRRELQSIARQRAFGIALAVYVVVAAALLLSWSSVTIQLPASGLYDGLWQLQLGVLALLAPWTVARVASSRTRHMSSRIVAAVIAVALFAFAAFPIMLLADRMEGTMGLSHALRGELYAQALSAAAVVMVFTWRGVCRDRILGWIGSTVSTTALLVAILYFRELAR
jgi:hypothetical protein